MKEVKNKELQERQKYVPASVKVIEVTAQRAILTVSNPDGPSKFNGNDPWAPSY